MPIKLIIDQRLPGIVSDRIPRLRFHRGATPVYKLSLIGADGSPIDTAQLSAVTIRLTNGVSSAADEYGSFDLGFTVTTTPGEIEVKFSREMTLAYPNEPNLQFIHFKFTLLSGDTLPVWQPVSVIPTRIPTVDFTARLTLSGTIVRSTNIAEWGTWFLIEDLPAGLREYKWVYLFDWADGTVLEAVLAINSVFILDHIGQTGLQVGLCVIDSDSDTPLTNITGDPRICYYDEARYPDHPDWGPNTTGVGAKQWLTGGHIIESELFVVTHRHVAD